MIWDPHQPLLARYHFIEEHRGQYNLNRFCQALNVSVSGYYAWLKRPQSIRQQENDQIVKEIKNIHKQSRETGPDAHIVCWSMEVRGSAMIYICHDLRKQGFGCSPKRIARLMRVHQIAAKRKRRYIVTTDSKHL